MRLGARATDLIGGVVSRALSGECVVRVQAPSTAVARRMFDGVTEHIERYGGRPLASHFSWHLPNGSVIRIEVAV